MANFSLRGILKGHGGWVTSIATTSESSNTILTSSRDKSVLVWHLTRDVAEYGYAKKALRGHGHFVQDVVISSDGQFALSASWDGTLRLWDLATGETTRRFISHNKDVLSVAFSPDNRQIVSASRDRNIKLWNTLAQCKYTLEDAHSGWVSSVRFSPNPESPVFVSGSWDNTVKVWSLSNFSCQETLRGHTGYINAVTVSPDGSLCATGGKDGKAILWDLNEGSQVFAWNTGSVINNLVFSPKHYWLCAATNTGVHVFDLESKEKLATLEVCLKQTDLDSVISEQSKKASALSLAWSADGVELFAGYNDGFVRVWSPE